MYAIIKKIKVGTIAPDDGGISIGVKFTERKALKSGKKICVSRILKSDWFSDRDGMFYHKSWLRFL